ncbi:MAG: hypothetical protein WA624_05200 [Methylocella sp.]
MPNRAEIGTFVAELVAGWDTKTLVERLELQVGWWTGWSFRSARICNTSASTEPWWGVW